MAKRLLRDVMTNAVLLRASEASEDEAATHLLVACTYWPDSEPLQEALKRRREHANRLPTPTGFQHAPLRTIAKQTDKSTVVKGPTTWPAHLLDSFRSAVETLKQYK